MTPAEKQTVVDAGVQGLIELVWAVSEKDPRASADMLEYAIAVLQQEEIDDRRKAKRNPLAPSHSVGRQSTEEGK